MSDNSKKRLTIPLVGGILIVVFVVFFNFIYPKIANSTVYLVIGDGVFQARLATNDFQREKGLTGVDKISQEQALLMVFPNDANWKVSVDDVKAPIDIVWLNSDKKIIYVVTNASSDDSNGTTFTPKLAAKYVIELPAGTVANKSIKLNRLAAFEIDSSIRVE